MADEDDSQKTEDPSERKLSKAKEKGQVGSSQEVKNWAVLLGGTAMVVMLAPWMMTGVSEASLGFVEHPEKITVEFGAMTSMLVGVLLQMLKYTAPFFGVMVLMAIAANVAQSGLIYAPTKIKPDLKKISLIGGVKRMFSMRSVMEFLKGIFKLSVLSVVAVGMAMPYFSDVVLMPEFSLGAILDRLHVIAMVICAASIIVMTVIATVDFIYQKYEFTKSMRMSRQDLKDEYKDSEGDPHVKARIRKLRAERAQQRMMANVPEADVVITNPTHFAVALSYKMDDMQAPRLVAKGVDSLAFRIREVAEENDVPVVENPPLARALYAAVEVDEEIPVEHYQAVAEVIGYVMKLKGNIPGDGGPTIN